MLNTMNFKTETEKVPINLQYPLVSFFPFIFKKNFFICISLTDGSPLK